MSSTIGCRKGTPLCATDPNQWGFTEGYPSVIRSLLPFQQGERSNNAQRCPSISHTYGRRRASLRLISHIILLIEPRASSQLHGTAVRASWLPAWCMVGWRYTQGGVGRDIPREVYTHQYTTRVHTREATMPTIPTRVHTRETTMRHMPPSHIPRVALCAEGLHLPYTPGIPTWEVNTRFTPRGYPPERLTHSSHPGDTHLRGYNSLHTPGDTHLRRYNSP